MKKSLSCPHPSAFAKATVDKNPLPLAGEEIVVLGHRGCRYSADYAENTLPAFAHALSYADGFECDVKESKDGKLVIVHGALEHTTSGKGDSKHFTLKELKRLDAGKGEQIPTLSETLALVKEMQAKTGKDFLINLEIKDSGIVTKLCEEVLRQGLTEMVLVSCFNHEELQAVVAFNDAKKLKGKKRIKIGVLYEVLAEKVKATTQHPTLTNFKTAVEREWPDLYSLHVGIQDLTEEMVRFAEASGLKVITWTVKEPNPLYDKTVADKAKTMGVHVISDFPQEMREAIV